MTKLGIIGATALSLSLAVATPSFAAGPHGGHFGGGMHGGGMHMSGMHTSGMHMSGGGAGFRGAHASIGGGGGHFSGGHFGRGDHGDRGFGPGIGFAAGLAAGSALGYGYDGYYDPGYYPYYGDDYAYNDYDAYDYPGYAAAPAYVVPVAPGGDSVSYCEQRFKSYDPASGTYLGYDGLRHPCP